MLLFNRLFRQSREHQVSLITQLRAIHNVKVLKEVECGEKVCGVVSKELSCRHIGQIRLNGRFFPAELLSDLPVQCQNLPTRLKKDVDIILVGMHNGNYLVTTEAAWLQFA